MIPLSRFASPCQIMNRVLFMGRKKVAADCLDYLAAKPNVQLVGVMTDSHLASSCTADVARRLGVPLLRIEEATKAIETGALKFDLGISMLYWRKFGAKMIGAARRGIINFHPAPLPEYKGTAGYNLAIMEGLSSWATSAHYVDESIDTGPIIDVCNFAISEKDETAQSLEKTCQEKLREQFIRIVDQALKSESLLPTMPNGPGRYVSRDQMEEMKLVRPGDDLERKTRAFWFPPYDGAYIEVGGKRYTLVSRDMLRSMTPQGASSLFSPPST